MEAKFTGSVLVATLVFSGAAALTVDAQPTTIAPGSNLIATQPLSTVFRCVPNGNGFATIAERGQRRTPPVITWNSTLGGQYKPQERCNHVSQRLTETVAQNGGKLKNLQLMAGPVKNQVVICVVNNMQPVCNNENMLFTLRPENAKRSDQVIATLNKFSVMGAGAPVAESNGVDSLPLGELNRFLGPEDKTTE